MFDALFGQIETAGIPPASLFILGVGFGAMLLVFGLSGTFSGKDPVLRRMEAQGRRRPAAAEAGILRNRPEDPKGLMKGLIPTDTDERSEVARQLALAGFSGPRAVRNFYLIRLLLGIVLPGLLIAAIGAIRAGAVAVPDPIVALVAGWDTAKLAQILAIVVGLGFFGPAIWLRSRANERRQAIADAFPNALDLLQISVEAGLGFDAAMIRVGNELKASAPAVAEEFLAAQHAIQAGRTRERALLDMANRMGVDEVLSFANVVNQSMRFGTSMSDTLITYATEMRRARELRAQEKANRLPVMMSGVMATLMLPALVLLVVGPVLIRYLRTFAG